MSPQIDDAPHVDFSLTHPAAVQCNAIYEGVYLLGTSLARPVIARGMIEAALKEGCE